MYALVGRLLELIPDVSDPYHVDVEKQPLELAGRGGRDVLRVAVIQRQLQVLHRRGHAHVAAVGEDGTPPRRITHIIDGHLAHEIGRLIEVSGPEVEFSWNHLIYHLLAEPERRLRLRDVALEHAQAVIRSGEDLIVEPDHHEGETKRGDQRPAAGRWRG